MPEISRRTGKPKRKPRGKPFAKRFDTRRDGPSSLMKIAVTKSDTSEVIPEWTLASTPKEVPVETGGSVAAFMAEELDKVASTLSECLKSGDIARLTKIHADCRANAERRHEEVVKERIRLEEEAKQAAAAKAAAEAEAAAAAISEKIGSPERTVVPVDYKEFPMDDLMKLADGIESARKTGRIGVGFSPRRQVMAGRIWTVFRQFGMVPNDAFRLTFAVLASERATDDERPFYEELWLSKMGASLYPLPALPTPKTKDGQLWHPQSGVVLALVRAGVPTWLAGDAGAGKTFLTQQIATLLGRPYHRLQGSRDRTLEEVVGAWGFSPEKGSYFRYGAIPIAMQEGAVLHIDEISALPSEVTFEMHAVCEGNNLTLLRNDSEIITPADGFALVANDNTIGEGERSDMIGTQPVNAAFRDRWAFLRIDPMPKSLRKNMVLDSIKTQTAVGV